MGSEETVREIDALVVGTGMGGVMALHTLTADAGLDAIAIDKVPKVGGTWYWNRYPGALSDTQSFMYQLPYDRELFQRTDWRTRYVPGPEIRRYVEDAVDFWDLRSRIQLETTLVSAAFDEESAHWHVATDKGEFRARFLITAAGLLSRINIPDFPGIDRFEGRIVHTADWPEDLDIT